MTLQPLVLLASALEAFLSRRAQEAQDNARTLALHEIGLHLDTKELSYIQDSTKSETCTNFQGG